MAKFSQQEQNQMRKQAQRRAMEMQSQVYGKPKVQRNFPSYIGDEAIKAKEKVQIRQSNTPHQERTEETESKHQKASTTQQRNMMQLPFHPSDLLRKLDSDAILIIALMVMLFKDGGEEQCDKKLLMALAYLLT